MDPFTILGIASNIFTFVDVGIKVMKTANEMYGKRSDTTQDASSMEESVRVMEQSIGALRSSEGPQELQELSRECQTLSHQLFKILTKLKVKNKKSLRQYFKVAVVSTWKASEISSIETKLSKIRSVLTTYQLTLLIEKASEFKKTLDKIEAGVEVLSKERSNELASQRGEIIKLLQARCTDDVGNKLRVMGESMRVSEIGTKILNQLRFSSLRRRQDGIEDAKDGTFAWILKHSEGETNLMKETRESFVSWLKSGAGIFHICAKPGAGKSTLMKFLATHPATRTHLRETWAKGTDLCYASFFFFDAGGEDEKSLEGLYRSILYTILNDCPGLMPTVFPDFFQKDGLLQDSVLLDLTRPQQIRATFQKFISIPTGGRHKICLFIDGLDEYKGDDTEHRNLAEQMWSWAANSKGHVKFCVSSRPHVQFTQTFAPSTSLTRQIHLHKLTRNDIARHCLSAFQNDKHYDRLPTLQSECDELVSAIVDRAEGVFLWVHFVVRFILEEAKQRGSREDLRRRLDETPKKLDDLYDQLLGSLKRQDRLDANKMLMAVLTNPFRDSLNIMCLKWLKDGRIWDKSPLEDRQYNWEQAGDAVESAVSHLNGWTRGLVELDEGDSKMSSHDKRSQYPSKAGTPDGPPATKRVQLFHKTVKDYLLQARMTELVASLGNLDIGDFHSRMRLAEVQSRPSSTDRPFSDFQYGYEILTVGFDKAFGLNPTIRWPTLDTLCSLLPTRFFLMPFTHVAEPREFTSFLRAHRQIQFQSCKQTSKPHFAAFLGEASCVEFAKTAKIFPRAGSQLPHPRPETRNMLLSACMGNLLLNYYPIHQPRLRGEDIVGLLIKSGFSGHDQVQLSNPNTEPVAKRNFPTVWLIILATLYKSAFSWTRAFASWNEFALSIFRVIIKLLQHEKQEEVLILGLTRDNNYVRTYTSFITLKDLLIRAMDEGALDRDESVLDTLSTWADYTDTQPDWVFQWAQHSENRFAKSLRKVRRTEDLRTEDPESCAWGGEDKHNYFAGCNAVVSRRSFFEDTIYTTQYVQLW